MTNLILSSLCFANPEMKRQQEQLLPTIEVIEYNDFSIAPKYLTQLSNPIKSENTLRNTFWALGTVSFVVSRHFYREASKLNSETTVNGITTYEEYEKEEEKYEQIRKIYWFTSLLSLGLYSGGLTVHFLERAEKRKSETSATSEDSK
jgi:hypothetical protein